MSFFDQFGNNHMHDFIDVLERFILGPPRSRSADIDQRGTISMPCWVAFGVLVRLQHYFNPDNGFLRWQREEREARGRGFDGIELIGG